MLFCGRRCTFNYVVWGGSLIGSLVPSIDKEVAGPSPRSNKDSGLVVSLPARQDKNQRFATRVLKGNAQKVDGAAVPNHL